MNYNQKKFTLLIANDDEDTRFLMQEAMREVRLAIKIEFVENGEEVLDYLYRRGEYAGSSNWHQPDLILLDLNMPRLDGRETLTSIRADPDLQQIPVAILTTSHRSGDILLCYRLGANSFISKPVTFEGLVEVMKILCEYWFEIVSLPRRDL
ncbi:response regulator [Tychonema sp. LEGE 07203]|uniref:response regulator n=1 Tax=Tychonema sp. LEGE 07203 TaxID=1828671 RepID=UPI001882AE2F|nr:response regulator [Tychonema sp. LEGE 07203]